MGIPYDVFWHLNPHKLKPFAQARGMQRQERSDEMWMLGQLFMSALDATVCNMMPFMKRKQRGKYPEKPYRVIPLTEEEKKEAEERELQKFIGFAGSLKSNVVAKNKSKGKQGS